MADPAVSFLLQNLPRLLNDEFNLLSGVEDKVNSLYNELKFIDIFLKNSMGKRNNQFVKELMNQIRDVAHKAEDAVDIYTANVSRHRQRNMLSKLFHMKKHVMVLHEVDAEIEKIKKSINEIYINKERYDITNDSNSEEVAAAESLRERRKDVEEKEVVGLVDDSRVVIEKLDDGDSDLKVVSIIGMGGLGKTTLARKIYNSNLVNNLFPFRVWGYVSNDYRPQELFLSFLRCLLSKFEYDALFKKKEDEDEAIAMSEEKLKKKLEECLKGKKYLIVLDDIWKTEVWDAVKSAFPDDENGSRILITSRIQEVTHYTGSTSQFNLPLLNKEESWELFSRKVFGGKMCPSDLESLGKSIVESCKGLPLAIEVLAGLVAKKEKSQREWLRMKNISWQLTKDKFEVMDILKLSYDNLPQRLKTCFLYFAIYPEDYEISARDVIQLWIAEGFIQPNEAGIPSAGATELEDIADYYLDELVDRSLVQVASRRSIDGGVKTCRIHDHLRDLCLSESKSDKCLEVCMEVNKIDSLINANPRRLSFHCKVGSNVSTEESNRLCTRSLFFFGSADCRDHRRDILKRFKLARVLYSIGNGNPFCASKPIDMKAMIHLRYVNIAYVKDIPASIRNLCNLEMLDVGRADTVSREIWKLKRLKHIYLRDVKRVEVLPESHKIKVNLQTLHFGTENHQEVCLLLKIDIFSQLKKLAMGSQHSSFHNALPSLSHLSNLYKLKIIGNFRLPSYANIFPTNLTKIILERFGCIADMFSTLGQLHNLQVLKAINSDEVLDLKFSAGDFPQLQVFQMSCLKVRWQTLEKGALPQLRHLVIDSCKCLARLPEQLWCLSSSPEVHVLRADNLLVYSLRDVELKNGGKLIISEAQ
ncbi:hypothetical protein RJT34_18545 [Clitoria ternatea]|uniref:Uncharacterized protein n=1 Tax=Clitoria ternatea TaxID=43366 RepID=A0AAN9JCB4_CLITE